MADLARGERIKALREDRHLTQPAVADEVGVTLRALQAWEASGALRWENAKKLARFFDVDEQWLWSGDREKSGTPDLLGKVSQQGDQDGLADMRAQLDRIEQNQENLAALIEAVSVQVEASLERSSPTTEEQPPARGRRGRQAA